MTLYEKRGRRYVPVQDTAAFEGLTNGTWLVDIEGGRRHCLRELPTGPSLGAMAAVPRLVDVVTGLLTEASKSGLSPRTDTARHRRAWAAYLKINPDGELWLERESLAEIAQRIAVGLARLAEDGGKAGGGDEDA